MEIKFNINDTVKTNAGTEGKITSINLLGQMPCYKVWDGEKAIWYYEMQLKKVVDPIDVLRYGEVLTDDELYCEVKGTDGFEDCSWVRIRTFRYESAIYYLKMVNGEVIKFKELS